MAELTMQWQLVGGAREGRIGGDTPAIIGREAGSAIHVESQTVSRKHAQVRRRADGFAISDLTGGRNAVIVNGRTISAETLLAEGDTVQLGDVTLRVSAVRGIIEPTDGPLVKLRWELGGQVHNEIVVGGEPTIIGRDESAAIVIASPTVSRQHARIAEKGGRFVITDATSGRNPIAVNQRALSGERYLSPGDVIKLGDVTLVVTAVQGANLQRSGIIELRNGRLVTCPTCHREVDGALQDCPWCGTALVNAETVLPGF
ncbi:MAG: FHA domain-containing protein [Chloroflexota bacterium]|nr:FHA domain-containing protein [Chloroflexota bacterium]MDQ6906162.1 FHA domain-containing protein [Chloroflexota bacterium]